MRNKCIVLSLCLMMVLGASAAHADIEELNGYFEIRDTIKLMNDEMKKGLSSKSEVSLFDEQDIEFKLESFISFMKNRVNVYAASDSKLKFHYTKKLNTLLDETSNLLLEARPVIKSKVDAKNKAKENAIPPVSYSTITHPYFDSIDFRTLASREPLNGDFTVITPVPVSEPKSTNNKSNVENNTKVIEVAKDAKPAADSKENTANVKKDDTKQKATNEVKIVAKQEEIKKEEPKTVEPEKSKPSQVVVKQQPVENSKDGYMRPMAIMIENHNQARPQSGLYKADIVYEIPVEGGITRFMGLYTQMPGLVGPVRSCREYFVDRALEVDALYVHCGGSPMGYAYISKSKIRSVDEIKNSQPFFRDKIRKAPHNLYGTGEAIYKYMAKRVDMRVATQPLPLNYGERSLLGNETGEYLKINYHGNYSVVIKYENGVYHRYMNNILHLDRETKKPLEASTVVLQVAAMKVVDNVGRQEISFIGSGSAWILEKGKRTKVTWKKDSPRSKTIYFDENGNEYLFNNKGQVWVQVVSPNHKLFFAPVKEEAKPAAKSVTKAENKKG